MIFNTWIYHIWNPFDSESVVENSETVTNSDKLTASVTEKASELAEWVAGPAAANKYENSASDKYGELMDTGDGGDNSGSKFTVGQGMGDTGYSGSGGASRPDFQYQRWVFRIVLENSSYQSVPKVHGGPALNSHGKPTGRKNLTMSPHG